MNIETLFAKTSPGKLFFKAAIPGAIGMAAFSIYMFIEGILTGRFVGETAFAALTIAMPFVMINFNIADLIGVGSSVPISIKLGQKDNQQANNIFTCACIMIVASGAIMGALFYGIAPWIMDVMGTEDELAKLAIKYLRVFSICSPFITIMFAVDNFLRICGKIRRAMAMNMLMSVVSVVLQVVFILIFKWGITGVALATCIGMCLCSVIGLYPFFTGKAELKFCKPKFSKTMINQILVYGCPNFLSTTAGRIISIVLNVLLLGLGGAVAVSIYGIVMTIDGIVQAFYYGVCDALQPAVSYNWGNKKVSRVNAIQKYCFSSSAIISLLFAVIIFIFPQVLTTLFIENVNDDFMRMSVIALRFFSITYITRWISFATQSFMLAIEKSLPALVVAMSTTFVFPLLSLLLVLPFGLTGLWLNMPVTAFLAAVLSVIYLVKYRKEIRTNF